MRRSVFNVCINLSRYQHCSPWGSLLDRIRVGAEVGSIGHTNVDLFGLSHGHRKRRRGPRSLVVRRYQQRRLPHLGNISLILHRRLHRDVHRGEVPFAEPYEGQSGATLWKVTLVQGVWPPLSQGFVYNVLQSPLGCWAGTAATYCLSGHWQLVA